MIRTYSNNSLELVKWRKYSCNITFKSSKYSHDIYIDEVKNIPPIISVKSEFIEEELETLKDEVKHPQINDVIVKEKIEDLSQFDQINKAIVTETLKNEGTPSQTLIRTIDMGGLKMTEVFPNYHVKNYNNIKLAYINKPRPRGLGHLYCFKVLSNNEIFEKNRNTISHIW